MYLPHLGIGGGWLPHLPGPGDAANSLRDAGANTGSEAQQVADTDGIRGRVEPTVQPPGAARDALAQAAGDNVRPPNGGHGQQRGRALAGGDAQSGGIRGRALSPGPRSALSSDVRAANRFIERSLEDHAERVAKRIRIYGPQVGPSAAERLLALRRRVAARAAAAADVQVAANSIEEYKIHFGEAVEEEDRGERSSVRAANGGASAAAAAAEAWHRRVLPGAADEGRQLSAG